MKVGFFDSGIGGLTIANAFVKLLPEVNWVYFADQKYNPYGQLSTEQLIQRSRAVCQFLQQQGCELIVVACNSATVNVIGQLRREFSLVFVGVEPGIKPAAEAAKEKGNCPVVIWATSATVKSAQYQHLKQQYLTKLSCIDVACVGLAELIENAHKSVIEHDQLQPYLKPLCSNQHSLQFTKKGAQHGEQEHSVLVLACTHYGLLLPWLHENNLLPSSLTVVDTSVAVAKRVAFLYQQQMGDKPTSQLEPQITPQIAPQIASQLFTSSCAQEFAAQVAYWWPDLSAEAELKSVQV